MGLPFLWGSLVEGAELTQRVWTTVSMMEGLLMTASVRQLYFIVPEAGYIRALKGTGRKGWLVITQYLIFIWVGEKKRRIYVLSHVAHAGSICCDHSHFQNKDRKRKGFLHFVMSLESYPEMVDCNLNGRVLHQTLSSPYLGSWDNASDLH